MIRVVLDTNTLISALLFSGTASRLVPLGQSRRITVLVSKEILQEYLRVLAYPKFQLGDHEIGRWSRRNCSLLRKPSACGGVWPSFGAILRTDKFLECAVAGRAEYLVTGDRDLRELGSYRGITILTAGEFLERMNLRGARRCSRSCSEKGTEIRSATGLPRTRRPRRS